MRWLTQNWVWIVVAGGMVWMHLGHGGMHGGHGSHRTNDSHEDQRDAPQSHRSQHPEAINDTTTPARPRIVRQAVDP